MSFILSYSFNYTVNRRKEQLTAKWKSMTDRHDLHKVITHIFGKRGRDKKNGGITPVPPVDRNLKLSDALSRLLGWLKANPTLILSTFPDSAYGQKSKNVSTSAEKSMKDAEKKARLEISRSNERALSTYETKVVNSTGSSLLPQPKENDVELARPSLEQKFLAQLEKDRAAREECMQKVRQLMRKRR